jgi:putative copper export protein/methionine-rich copper-binding protein CopC
VSRRFAAIVALAAVVGLCPDRAAAHAGLRLSDPLEGVALGDTPPAVRLSFSERPEASLSTIRVLDANGAACQIGQPQPVAGDPLALTVSMRPLDRGVYVVSWRVVSAVDGHANNGAYAFGVRVAPSNTAMAASTPPRSSRFEMLARVVFIAGLVVLIGAAAAGVARLSETRGVTLGVAGVLCSLLGVVLLAAAQRRHAASSFANMLTTSVGRALVWRAVAVVVAGVAFVSARRSLQTAHSRSERTAMVIVLLAALSAVAVHVEAGHAAAAAAGSLEHAVRVAAQWLHFGGVGIWLGGLAALLVGIRGAPAAPKAAAVRRFSTIAAVGLLVVLGTGIARSLDELSSWDELTSTAYGRMVLVKIALFAAIAGCGAFNRWRGVPAAATDLRPLRRTARRELALAAAALTVAAVLGALPPPAAGRLDAASGLSVSGADFGTTMRVWLTTASDQPGANRFVVHAVDYDTGTPLRANRVSLRFSPLDDPGIEPTVLTLAPGADQAYVGSGSNLAFDGRWRVMVQIERAADSAEVALELNTRIARRPARVLRIQNQPPSYTVEVPGAGLLRFSPDPERAGPGRLYVTCFDFIGDPRMVDTLVVTSEIEGAVRQLPVSRLDRGRFVADIEFRPGQNVVAATARTVDGTRVRAAVAIDIPRR